VDENMKEGYKGRKGGNPKGKGRRLEVKEKAKY
jgi:hypothetical protein